MMCVGIDPGITGAIAAVASGGWCAVADIPVTAVSGGATVSRRIDGAELHRIILGFEQEAVMAGETWEGPFRIFCEAVHAREGDRNSMQSQGSLMRSLGAIEAVCDVLGAPATLVAPQTWQRFYGIGGKALDEQERRARRARGEDAGLPESVQLAARLMPRCAHMLSRVKDHNRAEAALIARYGLRGVFDRGG